jgi:Kef-type K+ transport system membrane component KefB
MLTTHLLLALATILVMSLVFGMLFRKIGQPPVIGDIVAGIVLGPSVLMALWPDVGDFLLPAAVGPDLGAVTHLGVILFMFLVGLEFNSEALRSRARTIIAVSTAGIVAPFALGALLAVGLYASVAPKDVPLPIFAMFLGVAMSVTAFPVLARILAEQGLTRTSLGTMALACAAVADMAAWCLLALVLGLANDAPRDTLVTFGLAVAYTVGMLAIARPLVHRWSRRVGDDGPSPTVLGGVILLLLLSALATDQIGIHPIIGAFLFGILFPSEGNLARLLKARFETLVTTLFLPVFFVHSGMRTDLGLLSGGAEWLMCGAIVLVAFAGKFGGSFVAARWTGLDDRQSAALGVLMNSRGLVELIVLDIGLEMGILSPVLFTMMVVMALVTTFATTPLLRLLLPARSTSLDRPAQPVT